ncbi:hypothetical protein ACTWP5_05935 [Streptomyces sp. 4N509B]|uniref:hypothetical protein n=1 Tax=Streptomyces sp. 4N509B TaxID=3457413 RepID=UPI003FD2B921
MTDQAREQAREQAQAAQQEYLERQEGRWHSAEDRVMQLEAQVDSLTQAVHALIDGLERGPLQDPADDRAARGARLARELLLARGLWSE